MFPSWEHMYLSWEHVYLSWEHKILNYAETFSERSGKKCAASENSNIIWFCARLFVPLTHVEGRLHLGLQRHTLHLQVREMKEK